MEKLSKPREERINEMANGPVYKDCKTFYGVNKAFPPRMVSDKWICCPAKESRPVGPLCRGRWNARL